jgi:2-polyprenyl-6-methoxyphenol hydroxylase-like FAD-dependent oxidoreductase
MAGSMEVVVIGAGPAGLAVGACLQNQGLDFIILERN